MKTKTQKIPRTAVLELYKIVCDSWRTTIVEHLTLQTGKDLIVSNDLIYKAYDNANNPQKKILDKYFKLVKAKRIDEIKTLKDVFRLTDTKEKDIILFPKPKNAKEKYLNACSLLPLITQAYNNKTVLDWNDSDKHKWLPCYKFYNSKWFFGWADGWATKSNACSSHHFKEKELCEDACKKFNSIYVDYFSYQIN